MNKESNQDNPGVKIPPPLVFNGLALSGVFLHYFIPFSMVVGSWAVILGVLLLLYSFFCFGYMIQFFKNHQTEIQPSKSTSKIIQTGPFKYSRNPVYVFACLGPMGLGLIFKTFWAFYAFVPALIIVYFTAVKKEEAYLEAKFGADYLDYKSRVRRWL
jgi:protein-S-isoprenylcysteine O-methyltransferase Ste14